MFFLRWIDKKLFDCEDREKLGNEAGNFVMGETSGACLSG
jgi:hypothetical protein